MLELARLGVATRPGVDRARLDTVLAALEQSERVTFFPIDPLPISSAEIRVRVAAGQPIDGLVPPAVAAEIGLLRLYRRVETAGGGGMLGRHPSERTTPT